MNDCRTVTPSLANVLFVDDDVPATESLIRALERRGANYHFHMASTGRAARSLAQSLIPEVAIVDLELDPTVGPESGLSLIGELQQLMPTLRVLVLTGHEAEEFGIKALQMGAASFVEKPADAAHLLALIKDAVSFASLKRQYYKLSTTPENLTRVTGLSSRSPRMLPVIESVAYAATNNQPVLITGETGVGKGVIARAIHESQSSSSVPFIRFQPSFGGHDLVASELFGHRKGSFTGATEDRKGLLEEANGGTLFIDEVGELPHETQVLLLNVLQEKVFRRIGTNREIHSNFRLIAATNRTTEELLEGRLLREDLFHRIAHFTVVIPPLRERIEDIPDLANHFVRTLANREKLPVQGLIPEAMQKLDSYPWPGNVRELQAVIEGAAYRANYHGRHFIEASDVIINAKRPGTTNPHLSFREKVRHYEHQIICEALQKYQDNQSKAAESLQMDRTTLRRILKRHED